MSVYYSKSQIKASTRDVTTCKILPALAGRIATQLEKHASSPAILACLDDLLGAVYSLFYSMRHEYADRAGKSLSPFDMKNVIVRAKDMSQGRVREDGKWTAGFYFNNALFRLAAVYHRTLKVLTRDEFSELSVGELALIAEKAFRTATSGSNWQNLNLAKINTQVNRLKHRSKGIYKGRDVLFVQVLKGLDELLVLIETLG
jgi:hypothetical protein